MEPWTIGGLLDTAAGYLRDKGSGSPRLDAELLLAEALGLERIELYTQHERPLTAAEVAAFRALIARRASHESVAHILGRAFFRHITLRAGPAVLIPRPETEELVEHALETLRRRPPRTALPRAGSAAIAPPDAPARPSPTIAPSDAATRLSPAIADVGTGSGAIAFSLAQEWGGRVLATDSSAQALAVAAGNAKDLGFSGSVEFRQADLLAGVPDGTLYVVVSNPPYVRSGDLPGLAPDIRLFEPLVALDGGPDGLSVYRRLVPEAARALGPGGTLLVEVGDGQAAAVSALTREAGFAVVTTHKDLSRKERIVEATLPGAPVLLLEDLDDVRAAALGVALDAGAVIGLPTDTVYGLAARWDCSAGVRRLFAAKQRAPQQPVAALFVSVEALESALPDLDRRAAAVLRALLPGPFTFIVATAVPRPEWVGTPDSLGVRVPDHPGLLGLLERIGVPVAASSANVTGRADAATLVDVDPGVLAHCSLALAESGDAGPVSGVASTVVDLRPLVDGGTAGVLREGQVSAADVLARIAAAL